MKVWVALMAKFGSKPKSPLLITIGWPIESISHVFQIAYDGGTICVSSNDVLQAIIYILRSTLDVEIIIIHY